MNLETIATMLTVVSTVSGLGWWLRGQFEKVSVRLDKKLDDHETIDQTRHEQNLDRFSSINAALATLGFQSRNFPQPPH